MPEQSPIARDLVPLSTASAPLQFQFAAELFGLIDGPPEAAETAPLPSASHLRLVGDNNHVTRPLASAPQRQLVLPGLFGPAARVVAFVPRDRYPALDRHFPSLVPRDRKLARFASKLALEGRLRLGDIVQLSEHEILERCAGDHDVLARIVALLAGFGLRLASVAPRWRSPGGLVGACW